MVEIILLSKNNSASGACSLVLQATISHHFGGAGAAEEPGTRYIELVEKRISDVPEWIPEIISGVFEGRREIHGIGRELPVGNGFGSARGAAASSDYVG